MSASAVAVLRRKPKSSPTRRPSAAALEQVVEVAEEAFRQARRDLFEATTVYGELRKIVGAPDDHALDFTAVATALSAATEDLDIAISSYGVAKGAYDEACEAQFPND